MPVYKLNGQTYDIPEDVVANFEKDNPNATVAYQANGNTYDIPVKEKKGFLSKFPDAVLEGQQPVQPIAQQPQPAAQSQQQPATTKQTYTPSWQDQLAFGMSMGQAQSVAQNAIDARQINNIEEYQQKKGKNPVQLGQVANVVQSDKGTYLTEQGGEFSQLADANKAQGAINEQNRKKSVEEQLQNALAERDRLNKEMSKQQGQWVDADGRVHYGNRGNDETMQALTAAYHQNEDRIKTLTYERDNAGFWQHMGTELGDLSGWNPYNAVEDAGALLRASQKINSGQPLSESDRLLLANTLLSQETHAKYDQNRGAWFRAGGIGAESIKLMPDFIIGMGPMKGIATGIAKGTGKAITKAIGKKAAETVAGKILTKAAGVGLGTLTAGGGLVNTVQLPRLASEAMGNMTGELTLDEQGNYKFEGGDNFLNSVLKAEQSLIPEAASEVAGEFLPGVGTALEKIGLKKIASGLNRLQGTNWYKNYSRALEHTGFHGAPGEAVEEYLGDVYSAVLGDLSGIAGDENGKGGWGDIDKHIDILLGTATLGALLHTPSLVNTGRHGAQYYYYRHNVNKADKFGRNSMGAEAWNNFKTTIDNSTNDNISDVVSGILKEPLYREHQKAILDYAVSLQKQRGHLLAIMSENKEEKDDPGKVADVLDNSYAAGYEAESPEEKNTINQNLATATQNLDALGEGFASWVKDESNPPMATLSYMMAHRDVYTDEQIAASADYYQTKFAADGMQQAEADKAELEGEQSVKPLYTTVEQVNGKFTVNSFDKNGNLIDQQAFDTEDEAQAYQGEVKMQKQHQDLADLYNNPIKEMPILVDRFEEQNGLDAGTIESIINKDPMQMTDAEWQIADQAMAYLQEIVYPATEVHTDFNQEVGSEAADDAQIDTDMPNEQVVQSIVAPYIEAKNNLEALFNENEELAEEVQMYENMGKSEQEVISLISNFRPQEVQTVIDFYNAQARFEGFMNRSQEKIEKRVKMERGRRTFKGTINGQPDQQNLIEITDGTNTYTLVNGNISTSSDGRITGSDSGLILALDQNGDIVSLGDDASLSVLPPQTTLDMWEQQFREQMQVNATNVIDPNGALNPIKPAEQIKPTETKQALIPNSSEWHLAEQQNAVPDLIPTQENNASSGGKVTNNSDTSQVLNVKVDKNGVKLYEEGTPIDDAIADIQADGFDVNEVADASIAEAQAIVDKINNKQTKTRLDILNRKKAQDTITYYNNVKARFAELNPPAESEENVNVQPEQSNVEEKPVSSQQNLTVEEQKQQRIAEAKAKYGELFDDDFTKANDVYELVSMWVGRKRNLAWDDVNGKRGLQKELGWTRKIGGDTKYIETLLAKKGEGMGVDEFAHMVWESPENNVLGEKRWTTEEIKEALLDLLKSARSKSDVVDHALNTRIVAAEQALQAQQQMEQEMQEAGETIEDTTPVETDWSQMPFPPTMTDEESANDDFSKWFDKDGNYTYKSNDTERELSESSGLVYESEQGGLQEGIGESESDNLQSRPPVSPSTEGNQSERRSDANREEETNIGPESGNTLDVGQRQAGRAPEVQTPSRKNQGETAAEAGNGSEGQGSPESVEDTYLQPRNAEEEKIVADVIAQLQQEIGEAVEEQNKARSELEKAMARESERATDMFGNDNALNQPGQLFDNSDMPVDQSTEGVERRTSAEREKLQEATNKLNQLQSLEERNSRIRGALDNYRRQTGFEADENEGIFSITENKDGSITINDKNVIGKGKATSDDYTNLYGKFEKLGGKWVANKGWVIPKKNVAAARELMRNFPENTKEQQAAQKGHNWQYQFHYDKETGRAWITRDDVSGPIPVGDGRFRIEGNSLAELRAILENPKNNLGEFLKEVEAQLHNAEVGEQIRNASTPTEAIEQAAQQFRQEQEEKRPKPKSAKVEVGSDYGKNNKVVTQQEYNDLVDEWRRLHGQLNSGLVTTAQLGFVMSRMAAFHIEAGARKFADFVKKMVETFDETVIPYLKSGYLAAKYLPGMEEYAKEMDSEETVAAFDLLSYDKQNGNSVNDNKAENNDTDNSVSLPEKSVSEEQMKAYALFVEQASQKLEQALTSDKKPFGSITALRQFAKECGIDVDMEGRDDILLQELVEDAIIRAGRNIVKRNGGNLTKEVYDDIVKLYYMQPTISQRSSNRIKMQQYSTPLPMSFVADMFAGEGAESVLEPTAGNGMMVFAIPREKVHVNELDATRLAVLQPQPFMKVTNQDVTLPFEGNEQYDAIIANPPFGAAPAKDYDGKMISGLDEQIALNALSKMKDDGKAAIIIGGNMEYGPNGAIKSDKAFFTYLYDHYNVKGVIDMDGKLYAKQGTTYPTRMILIDGRRSEEERAQSKVYPPTIDKSAGYKVDSFDELYDLAERIKNNNKKTDGNEVLRTSTGIALPDTGDASGNTDRAGRGEQSRQNEPDGRRTERGGSNGGSQTATNRQTQGTRGRHVVGVQQPGIPGLFDSQTDTAQQDQRGQSETRTDNRSNEGRGRESDNRGRSPEQNVGETGRVQSGRVQNVGTSSSGVGLTQPVEPVKPKVEEKRELETDKLSYRPHNTAFSLQSVAPAAMVEAMDANLSKIEKEHGNIDAFVTRELGYDSIEDMHNALAAEQVDSVAMAIYQMKHGQGMIIGDQTGVGKGRQMAALIRWACRQGKKPVFITQKADLFSDIYRDLVDIGSGELNPFIFNSDGAMVDNNGVVVHKPLSAKAQATVFEGNQLPEGYDFAVLTYSQVNTGDAISQEESGAAAKERGERGSKKSKRIKAGKATPKATFLRALANDNYMFLDESHTAAGKSNTGAYFQSILKTSKGVTFASATFAKRPDTMPMYALRTAMSKAKVKAEELIKIIENGGVTLQEIMSRALTQAGQMVRRERDMSDVKTDWKTVDDPETVKKARDNYDRTIEAFNAIIDFQRTWVSSYLNKLSKDLADVASSADMRQGTEDLGISNVPFASKTYNYTKQLMLALKVDAIVDEVVKEIEAGRHPVIALENTMGSLLSEYAPGDTITETTFAASLLKGLKGVLRYTITDEDGAKIQQELTPEQLGTDGEAAYYEVEDLIRKSTSGIFISPLDAIIEKLQAKGYKVGELTGRNEMAVKDEDTGQYKVQRRTDKDKKKLARDFNSGAIDVLILNKSASTGISLHASEKFSDQRQRTMIIAQPLADINDYMQMIGRIDRTGQVDRGYYINLGLPVPAEGRFLMMLSTKLKSLNANTTTSQESESNDVEAPDLLNKYGSKVIIEYLRDNPDIYVKMGEPLKKEKGKVPVSQLDDYEAQEDDARKVTGYVALLPTSEQDDFYNDVVRRYNDLIKYLNDTGSNDLKISVMPLRARTIEKQVSSEGTEPNGNNPFAKDAYVEWVEMDVLKKPMKAAEIGKVIDQLNPEVENAPKIQAKTAAEEKRLNESTTPKVRQILDTVEKEYQEKMDKETARYEAAKAKAEESINEQREKINNSKRTEQQKLEAIDKFISDKRRAVEESHDNMVNKIDASRDRLVRYLKMFKVGDSVLVPDDLTTDTFLGSSPGIFCGFKAKDEGITPSTTLAVFCTLDGRRKIEVKLSDWSALVRIDNMTEQNWDAAHEVTLSNWDSQIPSETRKHGYIMTGNILQAFADAGEEGKVPGQLVTYTDIDGGVHDGILMNQHWEPSKLKGSNVPLKSRMEEIKNLPNGDHIISADGNVVIDRYYGYYTISVPKSKKVGGQYYENDRLLSLVDRHNFYPFRGQLRGDVEAENIEEVVNVLSDLGVQVKSDNQVKFDTETEMGQAMASGRFNNSQNTLSRNAETDGSAENDVPLERRTSKSYTDKEGNYHEGIDEELEGLESAISGTEGETDGDLERGAEVRPDRPDARRLNELRKQAARLRAEKSRREQKKQELRDKYNINEKGDISLDDLSRMFHDLNSSKILGKLFDKVVSVLKNLGVEFRFSDKMEAKVGGQASAFINTTFYNWDAQLRDLDSQEKARILLHEMIHNVASQILFRYEKPELGELTASQKRIAKQINDIYNAVKAFNPVRENGKKLYGLEDVHEMVAELANPEFRDILDSIPYRGTSVWQQIKNWFKKLIPGLSEDTALESLSKALDNLLDTYNEQENIIYRQQRAGWEKRMRDAGYYGNYVDFWETGMSGIGQQSIVEDAAEISRLESEPKEKGYRTVVQNEDGTFGSPMAGKLSGKKGQHSKPTSPYKMNQWERSEENPQLATGNGKINLIKPGGLGTVGNVDYNPYIHIRENKLNKQFKNAWERPDLVYIEVAYPQSELTSGYKAEKAAKSVGRHKWPGGDLILSRWDKPVRIVPWEEVADDWEREFGERGVEFDIVSPHLLPILAERGVKILPPHKNMGEACEKAYEAFKAKQEADPMNAIRIAARQFGKKSNVDSDPMEAIRRAADAFRKESNVNNANNPLNHSAKAVYNDRLNRVETVFSEAYQDAMVSLKTAQNAIAGDKEIPDSQNAYMAENLMHGKNKNEQDLYNKMFRDPLINTINEIMNLTGMSWGDIDRYVYTKSGLERNREFYVRDWLEAERNKTIRKYEDLNPAEQDIYDDMANTIETMFEDGDIETEEEKNKKLDQALQRAHEQYVDDIENRWLSLKDRNYLDLKIGDINYADYLNAMSDFIRDNIDDGYNPSEHDYSGFRAMYGDENGEYDEAEIIDELMNTEGEMDWYDAEGNTMVDNLWRQINDATRYGLERYREAGMRSDEQIDRVEQMFHFYVPMRGFKDDTGEDMYQYFTGKDKAKSYVGGLLKHAKGRGSEANYPISTIFAMSYKAISDCNQNLVNQKLYRLCQSNPNDLIILSDSWAVYNETQGIWEESAPDIPDDASEEDVRQITLAWEEQMQQLANDGKAKKITGKAQFDYKPMDKRKQSEHIVDVRINGKPRKMIVTSNPRMAQALNGQLRFERGNNVFSKWNAAIKNMMASLFTSYSPTFALRNMFRDWTHFRMMLGVREGEGYAKQANKYYRQSLFKMVGLFKKYRDGKLDESNEMERDFKDFMDNGGVTGYVFMQKIDNIQEQMEKLYKQQKEGKAIRLNNKLWEYTLGLIEAVNEGIENNARFATYRASRHYAGRTKARSAYDAKEITVNFNRKGAGSKTAGFKSQSKKVEDAAKAFGVTSQIIGEGKIFFNATVQAIATTFKNFQNADGSLNKPYIAKWAAKYALPPFMFGLLLPAINKALANALGGGDDDDPYANLAEWTRRRNICLYIGNDNFITIPVGQELAAFLALGDIVAGNTYAPDLKPVDRNVGDEIIEVMNTFSPVDISTKITKGGLMEDPISEVTGRTFSVLAPLVAIEQNLGWTGRPIYREDKFQNDEFTPEYQMVYQSTNPVLVNASKLLHELGGGDDITRGKMEVNPAIVQYLWEQYTGGPGKVFSNTISIGKDAKDILTGNESDFNIRKVEGLKAFVSQGDDRTQYYRTQAKYRKYEEDAKKLYHDVKGYESAAATDPTALMKLEKISQSEDFVRMQIVREADKQLSQINKAANKAEGKQKKELRRLYNEQVKAVVDMLDEVGKE